MNVKKHKLRYDYLTLELEDVENDLVDFKKEWNRKFSKFFEGSKTTKEIWVNEETGEIRETHPDEETVQEPKKQNVDKYKKVYRKLSMKVHPDHGGDEKDFLKAKKAYDDSNVFELLELADKYNVKFDIDEDDLDYIEKICSELEEKINTLKSTLPYVYGTGGLQQKMACIHSIEQMIGYKIKLEEISDLL